ncbi:uncharacterized protein ACBR49_015071 [Aulostomus maculatus]
MFRRSRFSVRPNVGTAGRTAPASQEAAAGNQDASEALKDVAEASAAADGNSDAAPSEKVSVSGDVVDQNGESTSSSAAVQRRKRFSIKPKVAPGRPSTLPRTPKSPIKAIAETLVEGSDRGPTTSSRDETPAAPHGLQSPRRRRPSEDNKQHKVLPKTTPVSSSISGPSADDSLNQTRQSEDSVKKSDSQMKVPPRPPEKVPPSLPDKEATEISEKAKTLLSSKSGTSPPPPTFSLSRLLNDPSDLQRLEKARKLRELLKQEMHKEKKLKKKKARLTEYTLDPAKMTMRDLIRYLPMSNPMSTSIEDTAQENETVIPSSPGREESPEKAQQPEVRPKMASPREEGAETAASAAAGEEEEEEEQEEALMVPQVKVAEDGSLIIDEESLTVEVQRAKGPNPIQDRDPIFERGSTTTYSSFRKGIHSKPWSSEETDMFFLAISMVGTDFSMICQLFPHRARAEIKNKFKKEERENTWRIDKAFRERRKLDIEYFSKLLEKILEVQKNRKKLKSISDKMAPKKSKRKTKGKKAARKLSDVEEEDEEEENKLPDLEEEEEGEKENEQLCNEGGAPGSKSKRKRKRQSKEDASTKESNQKKNKTGEGSNEQDEACIPEDVEAALPEDSTNPDKSENAEITAKSTQVKPAKLSRGGAPKPLLPLGRKWSKKPQPTTAKAKESVSDEGEENVSDGASTDQVDKEAPQEKKSANDSVSSEEEDYAAPPSRPTRYGRVPKPTKLLNYPAKDDASESTQAAPARSAAQPKPKCSRKRGSSSQASTQDSKKSKLVTLRASQSECSDEDDEGQREDEELVEEWPACSSGNSPVFVPASLRPPQTEISEVEETMEELDILANMPDVLGISQDALCPDASCEQAQNETGTADPCEHQLDLLVDVIDFLSSEHAEVSEVESYNEAAQTLLTIGNLTHLSQSAQSQTAAEDHETGTSVSVSDISRHPEEDIAAEPLGQEECDATPAVSTEAVKTVSSVEPQNNAANNESWSQIDATPIVKTGDQKCSEQRTVSDQTPQLPSNLEISKTDSPQVTRGRSSKVKPKPNVDRASRTAPSKSQTDASTVRTPVESKTASPDVSQATLDLVAPENKSHCFPEAQIDPRLEQATADKGATSESTGDKPLPHVGNTDRSNVVTVDTITDLQVGGGENVNESPSQDSGNNPVASVEELPNIQPEAMEEAVTCPNRCQLETSKPSLPPTPRSVQPKPPTASDCSATLKPESTDSTVAEAELSSTFNTNPCIESHSIGSASVLMPTLEFTHKPEEELPSAEVTQTNTGLHKVSSLEDSKQNATQRRRRIAKAKPNLGLAPRTVQSKVQPKDISKLSPQMSSASNAASEQQPVDRAQTEPDITNSKQMKSPLLEQSGNRINEEGGSSDSNVIVTTLVAENRSVSTAPKIKSNEKPAVEEETKMDSTSDHGKVEVRPVADSEFDMSFRAIESHTQQILDSHLVPNVQASEGSLAESKNTTLRPDNGQSTPQPSESVQQSSTENTPAIKSQDVVKLSSETREINQSMDTSQAPQCRDDNTSGASCKPSRKGPQTRRGRLVKPKPNLGRGSRAPQPQQTESATQADAATGSCLDASGSHRPVSGVQPDIQEPVEGAIEQVINRASPQNDAGSSLGFVTQVPEVSNQEATLASIGGTQGYSSFTIFPEMLTVPSDPDEPFFILSLTEIPVSSSGEVMDNPSEPLPDLPAPVQLQSVPGESVAAAEEDGSLPTVFVPVSTEETGGSGLVPETGPVGYISSFRENPVDPCEGTGVDPLQTVGDSEESNIPATKTRQTGRRAKLQVKPSASRKKQASKVLAYEEAESVPVQANTHQIPELPRPPRQREPDDAHEGNKALKNLEDNSLAPQTRTSTPDRKPHSFSSFLSETNIPAGSKNPPCAASKVSTQKTARPQTPPSPAASVSHTVAPSSPPETPGEARSFTPSKRQAETEQTAEPSDSDSTPSASLTVTEVSVSQQSDCVEVEPISVSQYFLSDIFTEVEEG